MQPPFATPSRLRLPLLLPLLLPLPLLLLLLLAGCSNPKIEPSATPPDHFALTLFMRTHDQRLTWFEVTPDGELRYAGGLAALQREGVPVVKLTAEQRQALWTMLIEGKLHEAEAGPLFPEAKRVHYDFTFNTGGFDHIVRAVDDEQPALARIHEHLFKIQAAVRYDHPVVAP